MFARSQPLLSPHTPGGGAAADYTRDAYVALVKVLHDPPVDISHAAAIEICVMNFSNTMVPALKRRIVSTELALKYLALKNPFTGDNVFAETRYLPGLVRHVAEDVIDRVKGGWAVSQPTLAALRGYVVSPHEIGVDSSIAAFKALIAGCSRCFCTSAPHEGGETSAPDPIAEISVLAPELRWVAAHHPREIADVVSRVSEIPVHALLAPGFDKVLAELSDPDAKIPPEVRHAAKVARARRGE